MTSLLSNIYAVVAAVTLVIAGIAALFVWLRSRRAARRREPGTGPEPHDSAASAASGALDRVFAEAARHLGHPLWKLPAFLVLGPRLSGKTTMMRNSGLEPELIAGQASVANSLEPVPTTSANIWLAGGTLFVELAQAVADQPDLLRRVLKQLSPSRWTLGFRGKLPLRAMLFCCSHEAIASGDSLEKTSEAARSWNKALLLIASIFGVRMPVYVLFTKLDASAPGPDSRKNGFPEFAALTTPDEWGQVFGAILPNTEALHRGAYADQQGNAVAAQISQLANSLADSRTILLRREQDPIRVGGAYQFPREFEKLSRPVTQFCIELAMPSDVQVSPFLRGFYFCGRRPVAERSRAPLPGVAAAPVPEGFGATVVLNLEQMRARMAQGRQPATEDSGSSFQYLFLHDLFRQVLLNDDPAHAVSRSSVHSDRWRASLIAAVCLLTLLYLAGATVSFSKNRMMEKELNAARLDLDRSSATAPDPAALERVGRVADQLLDARERPPFWMGFGLYQGEKLLPAAQNVYCSALRPTILPKLEAAMGKALRDLVAHNGDAQSGFRALKAYRMITKDPERADSQFLMDELPDWLRTIPASQYRTYGRLLPILKGPSVCVISAEDGVVAAAQRYLKSLGADYLYELLLRKAGQGLDPVDYNKQFPNSAVTDEKVVPGYFTSQGWAKMQGLLNNPEKSLNEDRWVLGDVRSSPEELSRLAKKYRDQYSNGYSDAWQQFLLRAKVSPYANPAEAVNELELMSSQDSVLLKLIGLAGDHTDFAEPVKSTFQAARAVVAQKSDFKQAEGYLKKLADLKIDLDKVGKDTGSEKDQAVSEARKAVSAAFQSVEELAANAAFKGDVGQSIKSVLRKPIVPAQDLLGRQGDADAADAGRGFCGEFKGLSRKFPFSQVDDEADFEEVARVLSPKDGAFKQFFETTLRDSVVCSNTCRLKQNPKYRFTDASLSFLNGIYPWTHRLSNTAPSSVFQWRLRAVSFNGLKKIDISTDTQQINLSAGSQWQPLSWNLGQPMLLKIHGTFEGDPKSYQLYVSRGESIWALVRWVTHADSGGGRIPFYWSPTQARNEPQRRQTGKGTLDYQIEIQWADGSPIDRRVFQTGRCVFSVAH